MVSEVCNEIFARGIELAYRQGMEDAAGLYRELLFTKDGGQAQEDVATDREMQESGRELRGLGKIPGKDRAFHAENLHADYFFRNSDDPCLHNAVRTDAAVAVGVRQVKDLALFYTWCSCGWQ